MKLESCCNEERISSARLFTSKRLASVKGRTGLEER